MFLLYVHNHVCGLLLTFTSVMEDDRQLQTGLQWQTLFNVCPNRHHEFSVWQLHPCLPHLFTEPMSRMLCVCLTDPGAGQSACHCVSCRNADISLHAAFRSLMFWYNTQQRAIDAAVITYRSNLYFDKISFRHMFKIFYR